MDRRQIIGAALSGTTLLSAAFYGGPAFAQELKITPSKSIPHAEGRLDIYEVFTSKYVDSREISVFVPREYEGNKEGLDVLYMHDGQNLYDSSRSYSGKAWDVGLTLSKINEAKSAPAVLVVGIANNGAKRHSEYMPRKIYDLLPRSIRSIIDEKNGGPPISDDYLKFIVEELKPFIDTAYTTRAQKEHTFIMGSSMGGLISFYAQCEYPDVFGASACLSMHFPLVTTKEGIPKSDAYSTIVAVVFSRYLDQVQIDPYKSRFYIDHGTQALDALYRPFSLKFEKIMAEKGFDTAKAFSFQIFPGEPHSEEAWAKRLEIPLNFLLNAKVIGKGSLISQAPMASDYIQAKNVQVWLPQGYDQTGEALNVIYLMDGQNGFEPSPYSGADWGIAEAITRLVALGKIKPTMVVAVSSGEDRNREYMPQGVYERLPQDYQRRVEAFASGKPMSNAFLKFIVTELKPKIDATYNTHKNVNNTAIIGASMGAHIALYAQGEYPQIFGASASLSMPWLMADPSKDVTQIESETSVYCHAYFDWLRHSKIDKDKNYIYTDTGTEGLDGIFVPYAKAMDAKFAELGWGRHYDSRIFEGAKHSEVDWKARLDVALGSIFGFVA